MYAWLTKNMKLTFALLVFASIAAAQQPSQIILGANAPPPPDSISAGISGQPGAAQYAYFVLARYPIGVSALRASELVINAPTVLTTTNKILVNWSPTAGATSYDLLRTTGNTPNSGCACKLLSASSSTSFTDDGLTSLATYTAAGTQPATAALILNNRDQSVPQINVSINNGSQVPLLYGNGISALTPYAVLIGASGGGVSQTGLGTAGQVLTSNGPSAAPSYQAGGGTGTLTSVATGCGLSGGPITTTGTISRVPTPAAVTGASYPFVDGDCGIVKNFTNAGAVALTISQAGTAGFFASGWFVDYICSGAGGCTLTPTVSTVNGAATLTLTANQSVRILSNGTNYLAFRGSPPAVSSGAQITSGVFASAPPCASTQFLYRATDGPYSALCDGSSNLQWFWGLGAAVTPATNPTYSWINQSTASVATSGGAQVITGVSSSGVSINARVITVPSTPYSQTACLAPLFPIGDFIEVGILLSDGTKAVTLSINANGSGWATSTGKYNTFTGSNLGGYTTTNVQPYGRPVCLTISDNATNRKFWISYDGNVRTLVASTTSADHLTPTSVGIYVNSNLSSIVPVAAFYTFTTVAESI